MSNDQTTGARLLQQLYDGLEDQAAAALRLCIQVCGEQGSALFLVGGAVRDLLLGRSHVDLDLAVEGETAPVGQTLAQRAGGRAVLHPRFGTANVRGPGFHVDLARTRSETYAHPGALPQVEPAALYDDLRRRDFSINAMALRLTEPAGELVDPFGGREDIGHGMLRVLHDASFQDDATRMLRGVRYAARLGFRFEAETERQLQGELFNLQAISGPRLRRELALLFDEPGAAAGALLAQQLGILRQIHEALQVDEAVIERWGEALAGRHPAKSDELGFCLLAGHADEATASDIGERLHLTGRVEEAVLDFVRLRRLSDKLAKAADDPVTAVEMLHHAAPSAVWALSVADTGAAGTACEAYLSRWRLVRPLLNGRDLLAMGVEQGEGLGDMLALLRRARLLGQALTREDEAELVRRGLNEGKRRV